MLNFKIHGKGLPCTPRSDAHGSDQILEQSTDATMRAESTCGGSALSCVSHLLS